MTFQKKTFSFQRKDNFNTSYNFNAPKRNINDDTVNLQKRLQDSGQEIKNLENRISQLVAQNEELNQQIKNKDSIINDLRSNLNELMRDRSSSPKIKKTIDQLTSEKIDSFEKKKILCQKNNASTYEIFKKEIFVLKEMNIFNQAQIPNFIEEIEKLKQMNHPNILQNQGFLINDQKKILSILSEKCCFDLNQAINDKKLSKVDLEFSLYQIAEGMKFIHFNQIIHANLKPSNILFCSNGSIKISDIGINKLIQTNKQQIPMSDNIFSLYFMALCAEG